jgi:hypothetical protein
MEICISETHRLPHELPCPCCVLCDEEHAIRMEVFTGPGIAALGDRPQEILTPA